MRGAKLVNELRFGFTRLRYNQLVEYNLGSNGDFNFDGAETGVDFADFLIGAPTGYSQGQGFPQYGRSRYFGLFAQDSWRVRPNITLNYVFSVTPNGPPEAPKEKFGKFMLGTCAYLGTDGEMPRVLRLARNQAWRE